MKTKSQKHNWIVDAVLFVGFIITFFLDLTGLTWHQWLGVFVGVLSGYHILTHWKWIKSVTRRFFARTSNKSRLYYVIDVSLFAGFMLIFMTGLLISTWLNLALDHFSLWLDIHIIISLVSLSVVAVKIGLHWRWIINTFKRKILFPEPPLQSWRSTQLYGVNLQTSRREFLSLMGIVSAASFVALSSALNSKGSAFTSDVEGEPVEVLDDPDLVDPSTQTTANLDTDFDNPADPETAIENPDLDASLSQEPITEDLLSDTTSQECYVRCSRGCSYPGRCRKYIDSNQNNICDLTECA